MRLEGCADHVAVQANHLAIRIDHALIVDPLGQGGSVGATGPPGTSPVGARGAGLEPQPQPLAQFGRAVLAEQSGVLEPALQQPHCLLGQGQALVRGAALEVFQQDGGLPGPLQILDAQVVDAVGHDSGVDAEQQLVGEHRLWPGEQSLSLAVHGTDPVSRLVARPADRCPQFGCRGGPVVEHLPADVLVCPTVRVRILTRLGCRSGCPVGRPGILDDSPAGIGQVLPGDLVIRIMRIVDGVPVVEAPADECSHVRGEYAGFRVQGRQQAAALRLTPVAGRPPQLREHRAGQTRHTALMAALGQRRDEPVDRALVLLQGAVRVALAVRVHQEDQAGQQLPGQARVEGVVDLQYRGRAPGEGAGQAQRVLQNLCGHQMSSSSSNSLSASRSASASRAWSWPARS